MTNYDHLHIENLILADRSLNPEEHQALETHLEACESCRALASNWREVEQALSQASVVLPKAGFTARWHIHQVADTLRRNRRQNLMIMVFSIGGASLLLTVLFLLVYPLLRDPLPLLLVFGYQLAALFSTASATGSALGTLVRTLVEVIPPTLWIGLGVLISGLFFIWFISLQRLVIMPMTSNTSHDAG